MKEFKNLGFVRKIGVVLIVIGATSIFPEHGTWFHKILQVIFVLGLLLYIIPNKKKTA